MGSDHYDCRQCGRPCLYTLNGFRPNKPKPEPKTLDDCCPNCLVNMIDEGRDKYGYYSHSYTECRLDGDCDCHTIKQDEPEDQEKPTEEKCLNPTRMNFTEKEIERFFQMWNNRDFIKDGNASENTLIKFLKQHDQRLIEEIEKNVIGEDEEFFIKKEEELTQRASEARAYGIAKRNNLRAEQRKKLAEL